MSNQQALECPTPSYLLYTPFHIALASYFGTPMAGLFLVYLDFRRLGNKKRANWWLIAAVAFFILLTGYIFFTIYHNIDTKNTFLKTIFGFVSMYAIGKIALGDVLKSHVNQGGKTASFVKAIGIGFICSLIVLAPFSYALLEELSNYYYNKGLVFDEKDENEKAIEAYKKAIFFNDDNALLHFSYGGTLFKIGDTNKAVEEIQKAIHLIPDNVDMHLAFDADMHLTLGTILDSQGRTAEAIQEYQKTIQINPNSVVALKSLGDMFRQQDNYKEAISLYQKVIAIQPDDSAYVSLGEVLILDGQNEEAIQSFKKAIEYNSDNVIAHYCSGLIHHEQGKTEEAISEFNEVLRVSPGDPEASLSLGGILSEQGKPEQALEIYQRAVQSNHDNAKLFFELGNVLIDLKRYQPSIEAYMTAIGIDSNYAGAYYNLGLAHGTEGNKEAAIQSFSQYIKLSNDSTWVEKAKEQIGILNLKNRL